MKLTDKACANAKPTETAYKLSDGQGMYLEIRPNGSKYWRMNYRIHEKQRTLALDSVVTRWLPRGTCI